MKNRLTFLDFTLFDILQILEYINVHSIQLHVLKTPEVNCLEFLCIVIEQLRFQRKDYILFFYCLLCIPYESDQDINVLDEKGS
jgi:hypothetical protein